MNYLSINETELGKLCAVHTASEIAGQPLLWKEVYENIRLKRGEIEVYLDNTLPKVNKIILTGAGTSAFIGMSLEGVFFRNFNIPAIAVPTTNLVSHPNNYIRANEPLLLISFARSGNSPESCAAVELADKICQNCYHLIITCDAQGLLANYRSNSPKYIYILPDRANDKSLAMTGSYSGMLLSALLMANINRIQDLKREVKIICDYGERILTEYIEKIKEVANLDFKRTVFLGSGPFLGTATESHLKLQELTDGEVICVCDSFLGFRHGPKAVINEETLVVYIFSNNKHVMRYEKDLVEAMKQGKSPLYQMGISEIPVIDDLDFSIVLAEKDQEIEEEFLAVCNIIPGQLLGFFTSLKLGLKPDNPSATGAISRVVKGVKIYSI